MIIIKEVGVRDMDDIKDKVIYFIYIELEEEFIRKIMGVENL